MNTGDFASAGRIAGRHRGQTGRDHDRHGRPPRDRRRGYNPERSNEMKYTIVACQYQPPQRHYGDGQADVVSSL